jgi:hypothetical protein
MWKQKLQREIVCVYLSVRRTYRWFLLMMDKINRLKNWQAALIITILGFAVYGDGLWNQFLGDDNLQIVNNPPVH